MTISTRPRTRSTAWRSSYGPFSTTPGASPTRSPATPPSSACPPRWSKEKGDRMLELMTGAMLIWLLVAVAWIGVWIWALVDAIRNPALDSTTRLIWVLVILFAQVIGAVVYLAIGRSPRAGSLR